MLLISSARLDKSAAPGGNWTSPPGASLSVIKSNIDGDELAVAEVGGLAFLNGGQGNDVVRTAGKQLTVGGGSTLDVATAASSSASAAAVFSVASAVAADALGALTGGGPLNGGGFLSGGGPLNGGSPLNGGRFLNGMCTYGCSTGANGNRRLSSPWWRRWRLLHGDGHMRLKSKAGTLGL